MKVLFLSDKFSQNLFSYQVEEHRSLLAKAEARAAELRSQVDKTDRDLTSLRKECNQLRNEVRILLLA